MIDKFSEIIERYDEIMTQITNGDLSHYDLQTLQKELTQLNPMIEILNSLKLKKIEKIENQELVEDNDFELRELAKEEIKNIDKEIIQLEQELSILLIPKDPNDKKNIILEIRAGTGGDEASIFAGELFQMYAHFSEKMGWKLEILSISAGSKGGFKEIIATIAGKQVFSWLKYEAGVHRVQRVPETETQGRIHTSACSVAILPEAEEIDIQIEEKDLRIDVFRAGGPGGQSVNTTDSAVRITHLPTGTVVQCQDEKSQLKNKSRAMKVLRARLLKSKQDDVNRERAEERKIMVKKGDRSDKIRTYNFPQDRCTDHRFGITIHNLDKLLSGDLSNLINQLRADSQITF